MSQFAGNEHDCAYNLLTLPNTFLAKHVNSLCKAQDQVQCHVNLCLCKALGKSPGVATALMGQSLACPWMICI